MSDADQLTAEQLQELMEQGDAPDQEEGELGVIESEYESDSPHGVVTPIASPIKVTLNSGKVLVSEKPYASAYTNIGLYVKGTIEGNDNDAQRYFVVPYSSVDVVEFDMEDLEQKIEQAAAEMADKIKTLREQDDGGTDA